jgi:hypothetical protein
VTLLASFAPRAGCLAILPGLQNSDWKAGLAVQQRRLSVSCERERSRRVGPANA